MCRGCLPMTRRLSSPDSGEGPRIRRVLSSAVPQTSATCRKPGTVPSNLPHMETTHGHDAWLSTAKAAGGPARKANDKKAVRLL